MKLLSSLILAVMISPAFAGVDCKQDETCLGMGGVRKDNFVFVTNFRVPGFNYQISTPNGVAFKFDVKTGEVIIEKDQASLVLGTIGADLRNDRYEYPLKLSRGAKFTVEKVKTGVMTSCTSSALGVLNKWKTEVALVRVTGTDSKNTVKFDTTVEVAEGRGAGICVFRSEGSSVSWDN